MSSLQPLLDAFYQIQPDSNNPAQAVVFGTSGHRSSSKGTFNERHIMAIAQAVADYRTQEGIMGPLFLGRIPMHFRRLLGKLHLRVLTANGVDVRIAAREEVTATPLVSRAILAFNEHNKALQSDGLIITPSHNPPEDGGIKYNTPDGGPADTQVTSWIEKRANRHLQNDCMSIRLLPLVSAKKKHKNTTTLPTI